VGLTYWASIDAAALIESTATLAEVLRGLPVRPTALRPGDLGRIVESVATATVTLLGPNGSNIWRRNVPIEAQAAVMQRRVRDQISASLTPHAAINAMVIV
jgi:hypothetical protein